MKKIKIYFRNDDPDTFEFGDKRNELRQLTELFVEAGVPLIQAVVPKILTEETRDYFINIKQNKPELIEFVQHGYQHIKYVRGEFDESRSYEEQYEDIQAGKMLMVEKFGDLFFPAFVFPFGIYTKDSMKVLDALNFKVLSCFWKNTTKHRIVYKMCHLFNIGPLFKYHISYHMKRYGKYKFYEFSNCINVIKKLDPVIYFSPQELYEQLLNISKRTDLIGVVLHYNTLNNQTGTENLDKVKTFLEMLKKTEWVEFVTLEKYYRMGQAV